MSHQGTSPWKRYPEWPIHPIHFSAVMAAMRATWTHHSASWRALHALLERSQCFVAENASSILERGGGARVAVSTHGAVSAQGAYVRTRMRMETRGCSQYRIEVRRVGRQVMNHNASGLDQRLDVLAVMKAAVVKHQYATRPRIGVHGRDLRAHAQLTFAAREHPRPVAV